MYKTIMKNVQAARKIALKVKPLYNNVMLFAEIIKQAVSGNFQVEASHIFIMSAALMYVVNPFDAIPDIIPIVGYMDDASALVAAATAVSSVIDQFTNHKAKRGKQYGISKVEENVKKNVITHYEEEAMLNVMKNITNDFKKYYQLNKKPIYKANEGELMKTEYIRNKKLKKPSFNAMSIPLMKLHNDSIFFSLTVRDFTTMMENFKMLQTNQQTEFQMPQVVKIQEIMESVLIDQSEKQRFDKQIQKFDSEEQKKKQKRQGKKQLQRRNKIKQINIEAQKVLKQLQQRKEEIKYIQLEIQQMKLMKAQLKAEIKEEKQRKIQLKEEINDQMQRKIQLELKITEIKEIKVQLNKEIKEMKQMRVQLSQEIKEDKQKKASLESELKEMKQQKVQLNQEIKEIKHYIKQLLVRAKQEELQKKQFHRQQLIKEQILRNAELYLQESREKIKKKKYQLEIQQMKLMKAQLKAEIKEEKQRKIQLKEEINDQMQRKIQLELKIEELSIKKISLEQKNQKQKSTLTILKKAVISNKEAIILIFIIVINLLR